MKALDVQSEVARMCDEAQGLVRGQPELRSPVARLDRVVRVRVDAGRHPNEHALHAGSSCPLGLVGGVQHDEPDVRLGRPAKLLVGFVVPVHDDPLARDSRTQRELELAERRDVRPQPRPGEEREQRRVRERLRAVERHRLRRRFAVRARPRPQCLFAVDDERRPELIRELGRPQPADDELAAVDRAESGNRSSISA